METKKTKMVYFNELRALIEEHVEDAADREDLLEFIDKQIDALDKRKEAAAKRAEKKKAESDALTDAILNEIGDVLITVDQIVVALDDEDVTRNKVTARLGKLVKAGLVVKEQVKTENGKRMAYKLAEAEADAVEDALE